MFCDVQYMPSASAFVPMYVAAEDVPKPYTVGSLFKYTEVSTVQIMFIVIMIMSCSFKVAQEHCIVGMSTEHSMF